MDYSKLFILALGCIGGYMAISYSSMARSGGYPIGSFFRGMSIPVVTGFVCCLGTIALSAFVNPWWSSIIVLIIGIVTATIFTMIFRGLSQYLCIVLMLVSLVLIPIYVFN
ncbi:hypothetical protein [Flavobacterium sp.]|uniref:hypothetical protein n=1 Tax=Flavobacterium sp. TaxID=239 RepID=UPI0040340514